MAGRVPQPLARLDGQGAGNRRTFPPQSKPFSRCVHKKTPRLVLRTTRGVPLFAKRERRNVRPASEYSYFLAAFFVFLLFFNFLVLCLILCIFFFFEEV